MRKLIIISILMLSTILLYLSFINFAKESNKANSVVDFRYDTTHTKIDLSYFNKDYAEDKITAIGVIGSETCASCVTELLEFSDQISLTNKQFFDSNKIEKYYVVIGIDNMDSTSARKFRKSHNLIG